MKNITITIQLPTLILILCSAALLLFSMSFVISDNDESEVLDNIETLQINLETARSYVSNNRATRNPDSGGVDYFTISVAQYEAMKSIAKSARGEIGYRIFFGKDQVGTDISIVSAVEVDLSDYVSHIEMADAAIFVACPPTCDAPSEIAN